MISQLLKWIINSFSKYRDPIKYHHTSWNLYFVFNQWEHSQCFKSQLRCRYQALVINTLNKRSLFRYSPLLCLLLLHLCLHMIYGCQVLEDHDLYIRHNHSAYKGRGCWKVHLIFSGPFLYHKKTCYSVVTRRYYW